MKRSRSLVLALLLSLTSSLSVYGSSATITTTVTPSYAVIIPESVDIAFQSASANTLQVSAKDFRLHEGAYVDILVSGSGNNGAFTLQNKSAAIKYEIRTAGPVTPGKPIARFTESDEEQHFTVKVPDWTTATLAGKYSGTITFTLDYHSPNE